jgi:hypothetical protein
MRRVLSRIALVALSFGVAVVAGCGSRLEERSDSGAGTGGSGSSGSPAGSGSTSGSGPSSGSGSGTPTDASSPASSSGGPSSGSSSGAGSGSGSAADGAATALDPFGCKFGWGEPTPNGSLTAVNWLQFVSTWVGSEIKADGSITSCSACGWLTRSVTPTSLIPVYYAYIIGFYGHANGLPDQNTNPNGANLATGGGALILGAANASCPSGQICASNKIVQAYTYYAQQTYRAWSTKPLVWLLEGDFIQYTNESTKQTQPLTYDQLGQLAALITTAIKSNMPNAVVAIDHSGWISNAQATSYWSAVAAADYDLVWTTGVGNNGDFLQAGATARSSNATTATYSWLHAYTGRKILVDESAGASQAADTWSNQSAATLNTLISHGVIGINVSGAPPNYQANVVGLEPQLNSTCP